MAILKHGALQPNEWQDVSDDAPLPESGSIIVSLDRWLRDEESLRGSNRPIGVRLQNNQSPLALANDIERFSLVVVDFPKFNDGRAFSQARLLRDRLGFKGEIRAIGNVLRDQYLFMIRCGIDAVELPDDKPIDGYLEALGEFSVWYQPAADDRVTAMALRHGKRAAPAAAKNTGSSTVVSDSVAAMWAY
ncbi:MAG: DUF934 domain-containing protein [Dongiaceae bacterium]